MNPACELTPVTSLTNAIRELFRGQITLRVPGKARWPDQTVGLRSDWDGPGSQAAGGRQVRLAAGAGRGDADVRRAAGGTVQEAGLATVLAGADAASIGGGVSAPRHGEAPVSAGQGFRLNRS